MAHARSHYELLGVESDAAPGAIRVAYIALMKQHHPNSPYRGGNLSDRDDVHTINVAYAALRDPARRAAYDAELTGVRPARLPARARPERRVPMIPRKRRRPHARRDRSIWLIAGIGLAAFAAQQFLAREDWEDYQPIVGAIGVPASAAPKPSIDIPPPHETAWIRQQAELAASMSAADAAAYSTRCFQEAAAVGTANAADQCIVFDLAFAYWRENEATTAAAAPGYFQPAMLQQRQARALAKEDADRALLRLDSLRAATFSALLDMVNAPVALAGGSPSNEAQQVEANLGGIPGEETYPTDGIPAPAVPSE
jgi:hypothetical protein